MNKSRIEKDPGFRPSVRVAITAIYSAACIGSAYALWFLPNVEIYTMMVFIGGLLFGKATGATVGFISTLPYRVFNPYGPSPVQLLVVQLFIYSLLGFLGGLLKDTSLRREVTARTQVVFGLTGTVFGVSTLLLADILFVALFQTPMVVVIGGGIFFYIIGGACNLFTFGFLAPVVVMQVDKVLPRLLPRPQSASATITTSEDDSRSGTP